MATVVEFTLTSKQIHIENLIISHIRAFGVPCDVVRKKEKLVCTFDSEHSAFEKCLESMEQTLPASLFLKGTNVYEVRQKPTKLPTARHEYPLNLALCPSCQKEMFDVSSRRYYYPFTHCSCCGGRHSFFTHYPYSRQNSSFKYLAACGECQKEQQTPGLRESHHLISCHECAVPVRLKDKRSERYANDAGSFRTMFEVAAKALNDGKRLLVKTTFGYRVFYVPQGVLDKEAILMMINASRITDHLSLIPEEFNALLSIERPILHVTLKDEALKELCGYNTAYVKYADEGFSILLGAELQKLGIDYVAYEEADEGFEADLVMDYDLPLEPQSDMHYFLNKENGFTACGERVSFPLTMDAIGSVVSLSDGLAGVSMEGRLLFDKRSKFAEVSAKRINVLAGMNFKESIACNRFDGDEASFMSVIAEHELFGQKCIGIHFEEEVSFLFYNGKSVIKAVPPIAFDAKDMLQKIATLREGSHRLIQNFEQKLPHVYQRIEELQEKNASLFDVITTLLELPQNGFRALSKEAMKFVGKGGLQIDMHVKDNRFDYSALLASIISYRLADVSSVIIAYSIFESFGDYFYEIYSQISAKTKVSRVVICGSYFANQSLFSRIQRNFKLQELYMASSFPIGRESQVIGGAFL